jgi:hypothetical protein
MGFLGPSIAVICVACLYTMCGFAQGVDQHQAEEKLEPYHKHHDLHHGHQHTYPDRGAIFREVPRGAVPVNYAGLSYRFHEGVWFQPLGPAFIVVAPPIGVVVPTLPAFATTIEKGGGTYLYANDVYYRARPDLGGYEVVNDPVETAAGSDAAASLSAPTPARIPLPTVTFPVTAEEPVPATATAPAAETAQAAAPTAPAAALVAPPAVTAPTAPTAPIAVTAPTAQAAPTALTAGTSQLQVSTPRGNKVFAYPRNGQSSEQQASDRYECYLFGVAQSGFDPMGSSSVPPAQTAGRQSEFDRAQAACFDGRGYTVR